eukprot:304472_1
MSKNPSPSPDDEQNVNAQEENAEWDNNWEAMAKQKAEAQHDTDEETPEEEEEDVQEPQNDSAEQDSEDTDEEDSSEQDSEEDSSEEDSSEEDSSDQDSDEDSSEREVDSDEEYEQLMEENQKKLEASHNQWKDTHAKDAKVIKADTSKWDNDWDKINKQREEIRAIKEKKRKKKLAKTGTRTADEQAKIEKSHNKWKDSHAKDAKVIKANTANWDNDWEKINKQREEIRRIKEKKRLSKMQSENQLLERNKKKKDTEKKFKNAHEKKPKKMAAVERHGTNWTKIEKERAKIKALKKKKRLAKEKAANQLAERNKRKKDTDKKFKSAHEKKPKKIAAKERQGTDWDKIQKQREEIRRIKERRKLEKELGTPIVERHTTFGNPHEQ